MSPSLLISLSLAYCNLKHEDLMAIADALTINHSLKELWYVAFMECDGAVSNATCVTAI